MQHSERHLDQHENLTSGSEPWYRYSMMWLVTGLPFVVVIASLITITIAVNNKPDIVTTQQDSALETLVDELPSD